MTKKKTIRAIPAILLMLALLLGMLPISASAENAPSSAVTLTFSDSGITASGGTGGYKISGTELTINAAGVYTITGSCAEGSIKVKKETTGVTLILQDLTLSSSATAPLSCNKSTETALYVQGAVTVTDKENPANEDSADAEIADAFEGAAIKVKSGASLTIKGTGTLTADGSACKNGIKGAASSAITVESGTLMVKAANNGLASDGEVIVKGGTVNVTAGNDGVKSEPDEDDTASKGQVTVIGGSLTINAQGDGIQATNTVYISGGTFHITTFGGCTRAGSLGADDSAKGIKASADGTGKVTISGGGFTLDCADDAIHSDGSVTVTGGTFQIRTGDDAIHADYDVVLGTKNASAGPSVRVNSCYEGFEGGTVTLNSGSGDITASDDGINAATDAAVNLIAITVNGGVWKVNAGGDGLDAGGDSRNNSGGYVYLNGGTVEVFGAANGGNAALDFDSACEANGGTLLAVGYSQMAQVPTKGTYVAFSNVNIAGGKTIAVKDRSGNTLYTAAARKNANHVVFVSGSLASGQQYTLTVGGSTAATAAAATGNGMSGGMGGPGGNPGGGFNPGGRPGGNMGGQPGQQPPERSGGQAPADPAESPTEGAPAEEGEEPAQETGLEDQSVKETEPNNTPFTDVQSNVWYTSAVNYVYENKIMSGVGQNSFAPGVQLTRGMMAQILYNLAGRPAVDGHADFTDVKEGAWYADAVEWAKENGIAQGYGNGEFGVSDPITRAQAAALLKNYADYQGEDTNVGSTAGFRDAGSIPVWAQAAMSWCADTGILQGTGGSINPNSTATRAEIAAIMQRYLLLDQ